MTPEVDRRVTPDRQVQRVILGQPAIPDLVRPAILGQPVTQGHLALLGIPARLVLPALVEQVQPETQAILVQRVTLEVAPPDQQARRDRQVRQEQALPVLPA